MTSRFVTMAAVLRQALPELIPASGSFGGRETSE